MGIKHVEHGNLGNHGPYLIGGLGNYLMWSLFMYILQSDNCFTLLRIVLFTSCFTLLCTTLYFLMCRPYTCWPHYSCLLHSLMITLLVAQSPSPSSLALLVFLPRSNGHREDHPI